MAKGGSFSLRRRGKREKEGKKQRGWMTGKGSRSKPDSQGVTYINAPPPKGKFLKIVWSAGGGEGVLGREAEDGP